MISALFGSALGLGGALANLAGGSKASKKIANAITDANNKAIAFQKEGVAKAEGLLGPAADYYSSLATLKDLAGVNGGQAMQNAFGQFQTSPGYQFSLDQGLGAVDRGAAARGQSMSGRTQTALSEYANGLANQEFGNYYNRIAGLAGQGINSAGALAGYQTGSANKLSDMALNFGNAQAGNIADRYGVSSQSIGGGLSALAYGLGGAQGSGAWGGASKYPYQSISSFY